MKKVLSIALTLVMLCGMIAIITANNVAFAAGEANANTVSLGGGHSAAIKNDGSLWMWGNNVDGQLGNGTNTYSKVPIKILDNVMSVSLGLFHSAAIKNDGSLWGWGYNEFGQLGNGTQTNSSVPIKIMDSVMSVSLGYAHSAAIKTDGSLWMWGNNGFGQLGNGTTKNSYVPIKILDNVASVSLGVSHSAAIKTDGSLWMWGGNYDGQLGNGTKAHSYVPIKIMDNVAYVSLGEFHSAAIKNNGSLWVWGDNFSGQLGNGTRLDSNVPIKIMDLGTAKKTFEEYFADNIGGYIDQITGLKLPHDYLGEQADAKGITFWSLFYNQLNESNLLGADTLIEGKFFYETILLQIISNEVRSNEYIKSLQEQTLDVATSAISSAVTNQKLSVLEKKNALEYSDYKTICKELELLTGIRTGIDMSEQLYKTAKNFDDVIKTWCDYNIAAKASTEIYLALEETARECEDSYLRKALYSVADKYKTSMSRTLKEAYENKTADIIIITITKAAVEELLDEYGVNALSAARLFFDTTELTTNVIYPLSNTAESICFIKSVQTLESYVKLALHNANSEYNQNKTYENAQKVVGLYDLLMKVYDYGMNESKLYADYHYNSGLFNNIYNIFSNNNQIEYKNALDWINSYNGALSDVKWYRTKAQIEYFRSMGVTIPVTVNTYYEGKVVNSQSFEIPYGNILEANYNREQELPEYFEDETIIRYFSDLYYDMEYTKPYTPVMVNAPLTLYMRMNIGRQPVVYVNGQKVEFLDQKALLQDNRTLVPARGVFETMGAAVVWNGDEQTVLVRIGTHDVIIPIGESYILVGSEKRAIDVPAQIINNRTMLPVRAIAEAFECNVKWDPETYTVYINTK